MFKNALYRTVAVTAIVASGATAFAEPNNSAATAPQSYDEVNARYGDLDAFWGDLDAFWGDIDAFYGDLDAFWGDLDAFYGNLDAFYGNLDAFWGDLDAFYGDLDAFWGDIDAFYGDLDAFTGNTDDLRSSLQNVLNQSENAFGAAIVGTTGNSFTQEVANPLLQKYGINDSLEGVENLSKSEYASFLVELHDRLMSYTGFDHVDHWMKDINWSPSISQKGNGGAGVIVGLLDTPITGSGLIGGRIQQTNGFGLSEIDHGAGVASVLAGAHDGNGVMGVAPNVDFRVFNPFDETFTASWFDVTEGIADLSMGSDASIINMSLGVNGYTLHPEWSSVFNTWDTGIGILDTLLIKSAGNSGITQTQDVNFWLSAAPYNLIVVGSVDPNGEISSFSNRPGTACLISFFKCRDENLLMNRFIVAPGEMVLVQDNEGNISRASGTSLAAPMVAGAAALVQSKWAWLQDHASSTADILLSTATDLGAPGPDEVYGRGLLNVSAALQPIDRSKLYIDTEDGKVNINDVGGMTRDMLGILDDDTTVTTFEDLRTTRRDFEIQLTDLNLSASSTLAEANLQTTTEKTLASQTTTTSSSSSWGRLWRKWKKSLDDNSPATHGFTDLGSVTGGTFGSARSAWQGTLTAHPRQIDDVVKADALPFQMSTQIVHNRSGVRLNFGQGHGAVAFSETSDFGMTADHDKHRGGVNPFLGLASGGFFAETTLPVGSRAQFSFGYTENEDPNGYRDQFSGEILDTHIGLADYRASAMHLKAGFALGDNTLVTGGYTQLNEDTGLLGGQGSGIFGLEGGTKTNAYTVQTSSYIGKGFSISASMTAAQTEASNFQSSVLAIGESGLASTAFQISGTKRGVTHKNDMLRLSVSQPLHVEQGVLTMDSIRVLDRNTGDTGVVTDTIALDQGARRYVSELIYGTPLHDGKAELRAFGLIETNNMDTGSPETVVSGGARYQIKF